MSVVLNVINIKTNVSNKLKLPQESPNFASYILLKIRLFGIELKAFSPQIQKIKSLRSIT